MCGVCAARRGAVRVRLCVVVVWGRKGERTAASYSSRAAFASAAAASNLAFIAAPLGIAGGGDGPMILWPADAAA